jgi:nicotinamide-nucleotide amidase
MSAHPPLWLPDEVWPLLDAVSQQLLARQWRLATAESCTGGLIAAACTSLSGSSVWFERGYVTYSNEAKTVELGVDAHLIEQHGAVSEPVARAMALGACSGSTADCAVAVTGVAGPTGGTPDKPVGLVWVAWRVGRQTGAQRHQFEGDRASVRAQTVVQALQGLHTQLTAVLPGLS